MQHIDIFFTPDVSDVDASVEPVSAFCGCFSGPRCGVQSLQTGTRYLPQTLLFCPDTSTFTTRIGTLPRHAAARQLENINRLSAVSPLLPP